MKTNLQNVRFIILAIAAVLIAQPVFAQAPNSIVITEDSSTSLTATYSNGSVTVTPLGPDVWSLQFPSSIIFSSPFLAWSEPGGISLFANQLDLQAGINVITVFSDVGTSLTPVMDEGTVPNVGIDTSPINGGIISLTFDDDGDVPTTVPDTGSTFGLLALALAALFGASRFRALRLA